MIDYKNKFIFVHIPRTGGTSIESILFKDSLYKRSHHTLKQYYRQIEKKGMNPLDFYSFSIVRNPFDKLVSEYKWFCGEHTNIFPNKFVRKFYKGMSFKDFFYNFHCNRKGDRYHKMLQSSILSNERIDYIGRFENLQSDFDRICKKISKPPVRLPNIYKTPKCNYKDFYTTSIQRDVEIFFKKDLIQFNYVY